MIDFEFGVSLRPLESFHMSKARDWRNDISIWSWCRQNSLISEPQQMAWFDKIQTDSKIKMFGIFNKEEEIVGACGFTDIDHFNQRAEFSCYIGPEWQRKGYARAALLTLFTHGFMDLNFNCIWGETFEDNPAFKLFLELGMQLEGVRRQFYYKNGRFINCNLVSVLRSEWKV